jgi:putative membrane protein
MKRSLSRYAFASTVAACTVLGACQKKGDVATTDTTVAPAPVAATGTDTTTSAGAVATPKSDWTDAQILAFATVANQGEIKEAKLAERKAVTPAVKSFARQMITDHTKLLADTRALATKLAITPDTTKSDVTDLAKSVNDDIKDLTNKKAGKDWDQDYINKQVDTHQKVLDKLQDASKSAKDPQVKDAVIKSVGVVQQHLTKAQTIKETNLQS